MSEQIPTRARIAHLRQQQQQQQQQPEMPFSVPLDHCDPSDHVARLARADELEERSLYAQAHLERGRAWLWAWANAHPAHRLCFVEGRGRQPLVAHFTDRFAGGDNYQPGWDDPSYLSNAQVPQNCLRVVFESPGHDVPADLGRQRRYRELSVSQINAGQCPWLIPTRHGGLVALEHGDADRCGVTGREVAPGEPVMAGASVSEFCAAIEEAGGWWLPAWA